MKSKHTPGPWTVQDGTHVCQAETGSPIANTDFCSRTISGSKANACLIASAPELMAALVEIIDAHNGGYLGHVHMDAARVAIAKARGES